MRIIHCILVIAIVFTSNAKANNNTFIDEHFIQDSTLVLASGLFVSALVESICLYIPGLPPNRPDAFCQVFAPEAVAFFYLTKSKLSTDEIEVWPSLNMLLFGVTEAVFSFTRASPMPRVRSGVTAMFYYQAAQSLANAAACYFSECKPPDLWTYVALNGLSTGLKILWYAPDVHQRGTCNWFINAGFIIVVTSLTYFGTEGFRKIRNLAEFIALAKTLAVAGIETTIAIVVTVLAGAGTPFLIVAANICSITFTTAILAAAPVQLAPRVKIVIFTTVAAGIAATATVLFGAAVEIAAIAGVIAGVIDNVPIIIFAVSDAITEITRTVFDSSISITFAGAIAGALAISGSEFGAASGAVAGTLVVAITGYIVASMHQCYPAHPLTRGLTLMVAAGLPLLISSWLVSLERFVKENVTAHETMQNEFTLTAPEALRPKN